jgi:hypothetical protein
MENDLEVDPLVKETEIFNNRNLSENQRFLAQAAEKISSRTSN